VNEAVLAYFKVLFVCRDWGKLWKPCHDNWPLYEIQL